MNRNMRLTQRPQIAEQNYSSTPKRDFNNVNVNALQKEPNDHLGKGGAAADQPRALESLLVEDILGVTQDPHSTGLYRKLVRQFSADQVRVLISETRQALAEGRVKTSAGRYFTDLAKRQIRQS